MRALLVAGDPGVGKTQLVADQARHGIDQGIRSAASVERVDLAQDLLERIDRPDDVHLILGRGQQVGGNPLCAHGSRREAARAAGYAEGWAACGGCPGRDDCGYWHQYDVVSKMLVFTSGVMASARFRNGITNEPDILWLDEGAHGFFNPGVVHVTERMIGRARDLGVGVSPLLKLVAVDATGRELQARLVDAHEGPGTPGGTSSLARKATGLWAADQLQVARKANRGSGRMVPFGVFLLLQVLGEELGVPGPNSRIRVADGVIQIRQPATVPPLPDRVVVLDSTGDADVYADLLGREVDEFSLQVARNARVYQLPRGRFGKKWFDVAPFLPQLAMLVQSRATAIVTFKAAHKQLQEALDDSYMALNYWGLRGTNEVLDTGCTDIVLLGTPTPNLEQLGAWAEARAWKDPEPLSTASKMVVRKFGAPYTDMAATVLEYEDERLNRRLRMSREGEMLQAAERIRSRLPDSQVSANGPRRIWIFSDLPSKRLEPDHIVDDVADVLL